MGFFDRIQKSGHHALKREEQHFRSKTGILASPAQETYSDIELKQLTSLTRASRGRRGKEKGRSGQLTRKSKSPVKARPRSTARRNQKAAISSQQQWDSDSDNGTKETEDQMKRSRWNGEAEVAPDSARIIYKSLANSEQNTISLSMIHGADITSAKNGKGYVAMSEDAVTDFDILLEYPAYSCQERFEVVFPRNVDDFQPLKEICDTIDVIVANYFPAESGLVITDESKGLVPRLKRAIHQRSIEKVHGLIREWSLTVKTLREDGVLFDCMKEWLSLPKNLCEHILAQVYSRTVSLDIHKLRKYTNGEDNVYGELLPRFVTTILKRDTQMRCTDVFIDLGSGVGNVVLQAALEIGCESWGCEIMPDACKLAELQQREFLSRCQLWGVSPGMVNLRESDFLDDPDVRGILGRADVILVNNQAFTPQLNQHLLDLFLELKDGARVVSLRSFVPTTQKNQSRTSGAIHNIFSVQEKQYYDGCVSWTNAPGSYFISTKDSGRLALSAV